MQKFKYEYFMTRVGSAPFKGSGTSIKKDATDVSSDGMAYRVYGCGNFDNGKIIVALESTIVLPKQSVFHKSFKSGQNGDLKTIMTLFNLI